MTTTQPTSRLVSIDALRGVAILFMIIDHCFDWWLAAPYRGAFADSLSGVIGTLAAPIFLVLVGVGVVLSVERSQQRGGDPRAGRLHLLRRGLYIIAMGYLLNVAVFFVGSNPAEIFAVDVLHIIGLGIILCIPLLALPPAADFALALVWAVASSLWGGSFTLPPALGGWINAKTGIGYFPILPWLAYVWFGLGFGQLLWQRLDRRGGDLGRFGGVLLGLAGGFLVLALVAPNVGYRHPRLGFMAFSLMVLFAVWALLVRLETLSDATRRVIVGPLALMGQVALMLYGFHELVGWRLGYHLGLVSGHAWLGQYGALTPLQSLLGLLMMIALCYVVSAPWKRVRRRVEAALLGWIPGFGDMRG